MVNTILRLKRKAVEPAERHLLVKGLLNDRSKRPALSDRFATLDVGLSQPQVQHFTYLRTISVAPLPSWNCSESAREDAGLQSSPATHSIDDNRQQTPSLQAEAVEGVDLDPMKEVRMYNVLRQNTENVTTRSASCPWTATRVRSDEGEEYPMDAGPDGEYVYDIYATADEQDTYTSDTIQEVQMLHDSSELLLEEAEDENYDNDTEDSNAEMHYTHDYPDEDDSDRSDDQSSEFDSNNKSY